MRNHPLTVLRARRHLTMQQVADLAGVTKGTVSLIEHNWSADRPTRAMRQVAEALDVPVADILAPGQITYQAVAEFFNLDPADPDTRPYLLDLKESVHAPVH